MLLKVSSVEFDTILAALRFWQREGNMTHLPEWEIATETEKTGLDDKAIDELCERINTVEVQFHECIRELGVETTKDPHAKSAWEIYHRDGELEIDDFTVISYGEDPGAYVMGWVWISDETAGVSPEGEDD